MQNHSQSRPGRRPLLLTIGLGFALRTFGLGSQSLWLDEAVSWQVASWPIDQILRFCAAIDPHPPAHYLLLHALRPILGATEFGLRLPSAFAGVLAIPLTFALAQRWFGRGAALWASLLLAIAPVHIWYSQEARGYALLTTLGLVATLAFSAYWARGRPIALLAFTAATALALYTHYGSLVIVLLDLVAVAVLTGRKTLPRALALALATAAALALYAPWLPVAQAKLAAVGGGAFGTFARLYLLVSALDLPAGATDLARSLGVGLALAAVALIAAAARWRGRDLWQGLRARPALLAALALALYAALTLPGATQRLQAPKRLSLFLLPCALVLVAAGLHESRGTAVRRRGPLGFREPAASPVAAGPPDPGPSGVRPVGGLGRAAGNVPATAAVAATLPVLALLLWGQHREDWRAAAALLAAGQRTGDAVVVQPDYVRIPLGYYWPGPLTDFSALQSAPAAARPRRVWLVFNQDVPLVDPDDAGHRWLERHGHRESAWSFPGVSIDLYALTEPTPGS